MITAKIIGKRQDELTSFIESKIPDFAKAVKHARNKKIDKIIMHQDAFAGDYQKSEYSLLGMAIKYAGLYGGGATIHIIGKNEETIRRG